MDTKLALVVDASIQLELNVADLYAVFHETFNQHAAFWWKLRIEERNHAALIRTAKDQFEPVGKFPAELISSKLQELTECNNMLADLIVKYQSNPPSEPEAFSVAYALEQSAGEMHYQHFMEQDTDSSSKLTRIFQQLNEHDKDHATRVRAYMEQHDIPLVEVDLGTTSCGQSD
jgi:hypothetical protein